MTLTLLRELFADVRAGIAPNPDDFVDAFLLLATLAGIDAPDVDLDSFVTRALAATSQDPWTHLGGRMVQCRPGGDTVPARSTQDAAHIAGAHPQAVLALVALVRRERTIAAAWARYHKADRILRTYADTPSHMRGPSFVAGDKEFTDSYDALRALGVEP